MKKILIVLLGISLFTSCVKDDVNVDELITNPLDPDYTGPSYIAITNTFIDSPGGGQDDHVIEITVDDSNFPAGTDYDLFVLNLTSGAEEVILATTFDGNNFVYRNPGITTGGTQYCYDFSVRVSYSNTRSENFCETL